MAAGPVDQPRTLGDLAQAAGDSTAARTAYQASLDIRTRLAAADPTNSEWQRDLSISHNKLGDLAQAAGDSTAARTAYQASLDIRTRLAAADPTNSEWQRDLSISHNSSVTWPRRPGIRPPPAPPTRPASTSAPG